MPTRRTFATILLSLLVAGAAACDSGSPGAGNNTVDNNNNAPDARVPFCGDGHLDLGEQCDNGPQNSDARPDACRTDCTLPRCGDGVTDQGEECDDANAVDDDPCLTTCVANTCGDGFINPFTEDCDDAAQNSDTRSNACRTDCSFPVCGDGVYDPAFGEHCDDGNTSDIDACLLECRRNEGFVLFSGSFIFVLGSDVHVEGNDDGSYLVVFAESLIKLGSLIVDTVGDWELGPAFNDFDGNGRAAITTTGPEYLVARAVPGGRINISTVDASGLTLNTVGEGFPTRSILEGLAVRGGQEVYIYSRVNLLPPFNPRLLVETVAGGSTLVGPAAGPIPSNIADIAPAADGFLIARRNRADWIMGRWLTAAAVVDGTDFAIHNASVIAANGRPAVASLSDGTALVTYTVNDGGRQEIRGRIYLPDRTALGSDFVISTGRADCHRPDVVATYDDEFAVGWIRNNTPDYDIFYRRVLPDGSLPDPALSVYHQTNGPAAARLRLGASSDGLLFVWETGDALRASIVPRLTP